MDAHQKVLFVDAATGYYRTGRYPLGHFLGPVDLGLHLAGKHNSLNIGTGLLAGGIDDAAYIWPYTADRSSVNPSSHAHPPLRWGLRGPRGRGTSRPISDVRHTEC